MNSVKVNDFVKLTTPQFLIFQVIKVTENGVYDLFERFYSFATIEKLSNTTIKTLGLEVR